MAKDPAFLFYSQDFIVGIQTLTMEERGQYITILAQMHQQGRMDEKTICFLVGSVSVNLRKKFEVDDEGLWFNRRLEEETEKRRAYVESRINNGLRGGRPKKQPIKKKNHMDNHMDNHMGTHTEDENENENIDRKLEDKGGSGGKKEVYDGVTLTDDQHQKLIERLGPEKARAAIERLGNYKKSKGKAYKSDYHAILSWVADDISQRTNGTNNSGKHRKQLEQEAWERFVTGESVYGGDG